MNTADIWRKGAKARYMGVSQTQGLKDAGLSSRYDYDERKIFVSGWIDMDKFLFMAHITGTQLTVRVVPD